MWSDWEKGSSAILCSDSECCPGCWPWPPATAKGCFSSLARPASTAPHRTAQNSTVPHRRGEPAARSWQPAGKHPSTQHPSRPFCTCLQTPTRTEILDAPGCQTCTAHWCAVLKVVPLPCIVLHSSRGLQPVTTPPPSARWRGRLADERRSETGVKGVLVIGPVLLLPSQRDEKEGIPNLSIRRLPREGLLHEIRAAEQDLLLRQ